MAPLVWEQITPHVMRCRLPFCDVTVGVVHSNGQALVVDTGTTLAEARAVAHDVAARTGAVVGHILLTHNHFDHVLGHSVFEGARTYCSAEVVRAMTDEKAHLRAHALQYGADAQEVDDALAALEPPRDAVDQAVVALGNVEVTISHPGLGHTGHDLVAVVRDGDQIAAFCGDLVEESDDPHVDEDSYVAAWPATLHRLLAVGGESAVYIPGHGAVVDASFVRAQANWLAGRQ